MKEDKTRKFEIWFLMIHFNRLCTFIFKLQYSKAITFPSVIQVLFVKKFEKGHKTSIIFFFILTIVVFMLRLKNTTVF